LIGEEAAAERIARLEEQIEDLREAIGRSQRLMLAGQAALAAGLVAVALILVGLIGFTAVRAVGAIALGLGGTVLMGSSRGSTDKFARDLAYAEQERTAAIDELALVEVDRGSDSRLGGGSEV